MFYFGRHVEELVRLPECFLCYTPSLEAGPVSQTPAIENGFVTFGSFNNLAKVTIDDVFNQPHVLNSLLA